MKDPNSDITMDEPNSALSDHLSDRNTDDEWNESLAAPLAQPVLHELLVHSPDAIILVDETLKVRFQNQASVKKHSNLSTLDSVLELLPELVRSQAAELSASLHRQTGNEENRSEIMHVGSGDNFFRIQLTPIAQKCTAWYFLPPSAKTTSSEEKLRTSIDSTQIGLWHWDTQTNDLTWDERMFSLTGLIQPVALSDWIDTLTHPDDRKRIREDEQRSLKNGPLPPSISRIVRNDGEIRWVLATATVTPGPDGTPRYMTGGLLDVTAQQAAVAEQEQTEVHRSLTRLTGGIAHHFNNMLMIIEPCLEELDEVVPASHRDILCDAMEASRRSSEIIRQLMTVGGHQRPSPRSMTSLSQICEKAVEHCKQSYPATLKLEFDVESRAKVDCSPGAIEQVLWHLLINARDALIQADVHEGCVTTSVRNIDVEGEPWVEVLVSDNGPGMSDDICTRVFEPFFTTHSGHSTGLGLATSQAVVKCHGGQLSCSSLEGEGTHFSLLLPTITPPNEYFPNRRTPTVSHNE